MRRSGRISESLNATTVTTSTIELRNASNVLVSRSVSYNDTSHSATFTADRAG
jgi:hypothetical protein